MQRGRNYQINRIIDYLLQSMMQKQMIGERGKSYQQLESLEHENLMDRMKQSYIYQISRDPVVQRDLSLIFTKTRAGEDVSDIIPRLSENIKKQSRAAYVAGTNQAWPKEMEDWLDVFTEDALMSLVGEGAAGARQKERIEQVERPGLMLRGAEAGLQAEQIELRRQELQQRKDEMGLKAAGTQEEYYKLIHDKKIAPLQSFLRSLLSKEEDVFESEVKGMKLPEDVIKRFLGGAISKENLYKLLKKVDQTDTKAMKKELGDEDFAFISDAYDVFAQQAGFESEAQIEELANILVTKYGYDRENALRRAREKLSGR